MQDEIFAHDEFIKLVNNIFISMLILPRSKKKEIGDALEAHYGSGGRCVGKSINCFNFSLHFEMTIYAGNVSSFPGILLFILVA